jgi:hypothetical protein
MNLSDNPTALSRPRRNTFDNLELPDRVAMLVLNRVSAEPSSASPLRRKRPVLNFSCVYPRDSTRTIPPRLLQRWSTTRPVIFAGESG